MDNPSLVFQPAESVNQHPARGPCYQPYQPVSSCMLGRWIKHILLDTGIDTSVFKDHSTRAACVRKVHRGLPTDVILRLVGWRRYCVF